MVRTFRKLTTTEVYHGEIVNVIHQEVHFEGIDDDINYELVQRPAIAVIVPVTESGGLLLSFQYRASLNKYIFEFPAGQVKYNEDIENAALRELEEETGRKAGDMKLIYDVYLSPHYSNEKAYIFIADKLTVGMPKPEKKEIIYSYVLSIEEIEDKICKGEISDAKTLIAYHSYRQHENKK